MSVSAFFSFLINNLLKLLSSDLVKVEVRLSKLMNSGEFMSKFGSLAGLYLVFFLILPDFLKPEPVLFYALTSELLFSSSELFTS